jgi:hypothetical protein
MTMANSLFISVIIIGGASVGAHMILNILNNPRANYCNNIVD